jgi:phage tail sheath protein FI
MANYVSPGVYVIEKDQSEYPATINPSVVGIVGFATKGPTDKATLITNGESLIRTFGKPSETIVGQGLEGALEILEATNQLYFVRCASGNAVDAAADIAIAGCPFVAVSAGFGTGTACDMRVIVKDNLGVTQTDQTYSLSGGSSTTLSALKYVLGDNNDADHAKLGAYTLNGSAVIVGHYAGSGATIQVSSNLSEGSNYLFSEVVSGTTPSGTASADKTVYGVTLYPSEVKYKLESLYPGTGYNYSQTADDVVTGLYANTTNLGGNKSTLNIFEDGVSVETFDVNFVDGTSFIETKINTGTDNLKSALIKGNIEVDGADVTVTALSDFTGTLSSLIGAPTDAGYIGNGHNTLSSYVNPPFVKLERITRSKFVDGTDGIPASTETGNINSLLIGTSTAAGKTGMQVFDNELLNISMAAVPGITNEAVQNALVTLAESTKEFLAVLSPPYAIGSAQNAIDWSNGLSTARSSAINSSYAAIYYPWLKVYSVFDELDRWYDPAIFAIRQMCVTDEVSESWFAPAGFTRGRLTKPTDTEIDLSQGDRDAMYSAGNVINPIVNFPQQGITIFGQRTTQRTPSALDRVNVRRLMIIVRKLILRSTRQFAFEPNDPATWSRISALTTSLISPIARRRGITDFSVTCDETTNTPARIEKGELWCKVVIRPTKTAEIIVFELNLVNQTASVTE